MKYIAYVDNHKKIALTRVLGNEKTIGALTRIKSALGYEPVHYAIVASSEDEAKLVIAYTFGEETNFISAFSNPT